VSRTKGKVFFSKTEVVHLTVAALLVAALGFSPAIYGQGNMDLLVIVSAVLLTSFFTHEIAHKAIAQKMGFWAEFRLTLVGAALTLLSVISTFIKIISPGAVMISGHTDAKSLGKISIVGPATNMVLAATCICAAFLLPQYGWAFKLGAIFNGWIVFFNLIPFGVLDGMKVFSWNKVVWTLAIGTGLTLLLLSFELPYSI
jgi:Zn-dependent protease